MRWFDIQRAFLAEGPGKYAPMFSMFFDENGRLPDWASRRIASVEALLKRSDRIIWALRWERLIALDKYPVRGDKEVLRRRMLKDLNIQDAQKGITEYEILMRDGFPHWFSMPIKAIQNYDFTRQAPEQIDRDFRQFEQKWVESRNQIVNHEKDYPPPSEENEDEEDEEDEDEEYHDEDVTKWRKAVEEKGPISIFMPLNEKWAWWDLNRAYCKREGSAMGHCGNAAAAAPGDRVLSLRQNLGNGEFRPSLTFILHKDGYLGEMKGRANEKPKPEYYPYIVALLKDPRIHGIRGGGYASDRNFTILDLPEEERNALLRVKPTLLSLNDRYAFYVEDPSAKNREALEESLERDMKRNGFGGECKGFDFDRQPLILLERPTTLEHLCTKLPLLSELSELFEELPDEFYNKFRQTKDHDKAEELAKIAYEDYFHELADALLSYAEPRYELDGVEYRKLGANRYALSMTIYDYLHPSSQSLDYDDEDPRPLFERLDSLTDESRLGPNEYEWSDVRDNFNIDGQLLPVLKWVFSWGLKNGERKDAVNALFDAVREDSPDAPYFSNHPDQLKFDLGNEDD